MSMTENELSRIAELARQRIDGGVTHHGEQWRLGGRTAINFMLDKLARNLATPEPPTPQQMTTHGKAFSVGDRVVWSDMYDTEFQGTITEVVPPHASDTRYTIALDGGATFKGERAAHIRRLSMIERDSANSVSGKVVGTIGHGLTEREE